jgi:hypothetical protein
MKIKLSSAKKSGQTALFTLLELVGRVPSHFPAGWKYFLSIYKFSVVKYNDKESFWTSIEEEIYHV